MNTHDKYELPPLPEPIFLSDHQGDGEYFEADDMKGYASAAIEPYQRRIAELESQLEAIGAGGVTRGQRLIEADRKRRGEPVKKKDWNVELSSWSDEDFVQVFHERPDLADRLRRALAEPVKVPSDAEVASLALRHEAHGEKWPDAEYRFREVDLLSFARAILARYGQPAQPADDLRLDGPAQVGNARFGKGIKWETVIKAAQRHHEFMQEPEREAERIKLAEHAIKHLQKGEPMPSHLECYEAMIASQPSASTELAAIHSAARSAGFSFEKDDQGVVRMVPYVQGHGS